MILVSTSDSVRQRSVFSCEYTVCSSCRLASRSSDASYLRISALKSTLLLFKTIWSLGKKVITEPFFSFHAEKFTLTEASPSVHSAIMPQLITVGSSLHSSNVPSPRKLLCMGRISKSFSSIRYPSIVIVFYFFDSVFDCKYRHFMV